jgi:hypothetical protein
LGEVDICAGGGVEKDERGKKKEEGIAGAGHEK